VTKRTTPESTPAVDFDLRQLEVFRKVVELESFSKAADVVFLAQASVSERIANLENMSGLKLLDRLGRRVVPTKAGELLYKHALNLLEMKRLACAEMEDFLGIRRGEVRIGGSTIPGEYILPKVMGPFGKKHPLVVLTLVIADSSGIESKVLQGDLELGVIGRKTSHRSLATNPLWQDELVIAVPPGHRWARREEVSLEELTDEPFILRESGSGTLKTLDDYLRAAGLEGIGSLRIVARLGTSTAVKEGIKAGLGVSILSSLAMSTEFETGILKQLKVKGLRMTRSFDLIRDKRRTPSPLCKAFIDFLISSSKRKSLPLPRM
jgi:DNA-binding transcriptional LysR family regulator